MSPIESVALKMAIDEFNNGRAGNDERRKTYQAELESGKADQDRKDVLHYEIGYASGYTSAMTHAMHIIDAIRLAGTQS